MLINVNKRWVWGKLGSEFWESLEALGLKRFWKFLERFRKKQKCFCLFLGYPVLLVVLEMAGAESVTPGHYIKRGVYEK